MDKNREDKRNFLKNKYFNNSIYCITAENYSKGRNNIKVVSDMLEAGIKIIQYREKENMKKYMKEKYEECSIIRDITKKYDALFIVDDYIDLALAVKADGVHIGQDDLPIDVVRSLVGEDKIIGLSTHSEKQAEEAFRSSADYIGVGPIFPTSTKTDVSDAVGLKYLDYVVENIDMPFVAIGGIKSSNIDLIIEHKAMSISMITEIVTSEDIKSKCEEMIKKMQG